MIQKVKFVSQPYFKPGWADWTDRQLFEQPAQEACLGSVGEGSPFGTKRDLNWSAVSLANFAAPEYGQPMSLRCGTQQSLVICSEIAQGSPGNQTTTTKGFVHVRLHMSNRELPSKRVAAFQAISDIVVQPSDDAWRSLGAPKASEARAVPMADPGSVPSAGQAGGPMMGSLPPGAQVGARAGNKHAAFLGPVWQHSVEIFSLVRLSLSKRWCTALQVSNLMQFSRPASGRNVQHGCILFPRLRSSFTCESRRLDFRQRYGKPLCAHVSPG